MGGERKSREWLLAAALLASFFLPGLGSNEAGTHPDEALYLAISTEMADRGAWLDAWAEAQLSFHKPPLLYWAQRLCYLALGEGLFAGRLPAALAALGLALLVGALARRIYGPGSGLLAALFTGSFLGVIRFGRLAMMDVPLALAIALASYGAWLAAEEKKPRALLLCGVGAAAAMLLKGPVGVLLVLLIAGGFLALRQWRLLFGRWALGALILGAGLSLPWFAAATARHGRAFLEGFFLRENVEKFHGEWRVLDELGLLLALPVLLLPWTVLALGGARARLDRARSWLLEPAQLLPALWVGAVLLVYSLPAVKQPHYVLPAIPAAALWASAGPAPRWASRLTALMLLLASLAVLLALRWPLPVAAMVAAGGAGALLLGAAKLLLSGRTAASVASFGIAVSLLLGVALPLSSPPLLPRQALARAATRPLYLYGLYPGVHRFAAGRYIHRVWAEEELLVALRQGAAAILSEGELQSLPRGLGLTELARWKRLRRSLPVELVLRSWLAGDLGPLQEENVLVAAR